MEFGSLVAQISMHGIILKLNLKLLFFQNFYFYHKFFKLILCHGNLGH